MKYMRNPLEVVWYYVPEYNEYFEYIEHVGDLILLDGSNLFTTPFTIPKDQCREATYEEVRRFNNEE